MSKHDFKTKVSTLIQRRIEDQNVANYENNKQDYRKRFVKKEEGSGKWFDGIWVRTSCFCRNQFFLFLQLIFCVFFFSYSFFNLSFWPSQSEILAAPFSGVLYRPRHLIVHQASKSFVTTILGFCLKRLISWFLLKSSTIFVACVCTIVHNSFMT